MCVVNNNYNKGTVRSESESDLMRCLKKIQILTPKAKSVCAFNFGVAPDAAASPAVFSAPGDDEVNEH